MLDSPNQTATLRQLLSSLISTVPFGILIISDQLEVTALNSKAINYLGFDDSVAPDQFIDHYYQELLEHAPDLFDQIEKLICHSYYRTIDLNSFNIDGKNLTIKCRKMITGMLIVLDDLTEEMALLYRATHDSLTQLSNRQHFEESFQEILSIETLPNSHGALVFIDIDNFKPVNDSAGHDAGDQLLKRIATLLKSRIRSGDLVARIGGDEFALLLNNCSPENALSLVNDIRQRAEKETVSNQGAFLKITLSAGIVPFSTTNLPDLSKLLSVADAACQTAKDGGRNQVHIINEENSEYENYINNAKWLDEINRAIQESSFLLYAQKIELIHSESSVPYFEVLLRLQNSDEKIVAPHSFIPIAERYSLMPEIDRYVMTSLCRSIGSQNVCTYSVNLSGQTISDISFIQFINKLQETYIFNPESIIFEITETAAIRDMDKSIEVMTALKEQGFRFSLDDFGMGLSSYSYLKKLPIDILKIDGFFVKDIVQDRTSYQIVKSIHDIGQVMGLKTVAEFVESKSIYDCLSNIGVEYAQGYYIHKPESLSHILD